MANKFFRVLETAMKAAMLITIVFMSIQIGDMYSDYKQENPIGNWYGFFTHQEVEERQADEPVSAEFLGKVSAYNKVIRTTWIALFFFCMAEIFLFLQDRKEHWIGMIIKKIEKSKDEKGIEDEEETDN